MPRPSVKDRARMFTAKARPSISGQGGNAALYAVAAALVIGFGLDDADAYDLLANYNRTSCSPAWSESELRRTLKNARRAAERDPSAVGELARADGDGFTPREPVPARRSSPANASGGVPRPAGQSPPSGSPAPDKARTPRTPVFNVRSDGGGGRCLTPRTIRTLQIQPRPYRETETAKPVAESENSASAVSPDLREAKKVSPRPAGNERPLETGPNWTTIWFDTGEILRDGRVIGNLNTKRNGNPGRVGGG